MCIFKIKSNQDPIVGSKFVTRQFERHLNTVDELVSSCFGDAKLDR